MISSNIKVSTIKYIILRSTKYQNIKYIIPKYQSIKHRMSETKTNHLPGGDGADEGEVRQGLPVVLENHLLQDVHARVMPLHHILVSQRPPRLVVDFEALLSRKEATARRRQPIEVTQRQPCQYGEEENTKSEILFHNNL